MKSKNSVVKVMRKATTKKNPKCIPKGSDIFRSASFRPLLCHNEMCRAKDPVPEKRIYKDRTLEFGIVIDKYLFHEMKVDLLS